MSKKPWQYFQEWVAKKTGGRVVKRTHYGDSKPDVLSPADVPMVLFECKRQEELAKYIKEAVAQAERYCAGGEYANLIPVAVFGEPYYKTVIVMLDFWTFWGLIEDHIQLIEDYNVISEVSF